jgi:ubiquinone/menaquinone biosynthesis C-methylase UbiE
MAVADIGAGTGFFTMMMSDRVGTSGRVYGVEIAGKFLERIEATAAKEGRKNVTTVLCTERSVELPAASIDLAFVCDTYHHFEYPHSTLRSIHRALRPGGMFVVVDFERVEGKSRPWVLEHVRAGREAFISEIRSEKFELVDLPPTPYLQENYMLRFRKAG